MRFALLLLCACAASHTPADAEPDAPCEPPRGPHEITFELVHGDCAQLEPIILELDRETRADACIARPEARSDCSTHLEVTCAHGSVRWSLRGHLDHELAGRFGYEAEAIIGSCSATYDATGPMSRHAGTAPYKPSPSTSRQTASAR